MSGFQIDSIALLRAEFGAEAESGFPRLHRIPQTNIIQFLDYFVSLNPLEQSTLLDDLALRAAALLDPGSADHFPPTPAFDNYWSTINAPGSFCGGYRYCSIKFLASVPKIKEFGGYTGWVENYQRPWVSERALHPREDLLPHLSYLVPAPPAKLRKLIKAAFQTQGFTPEETKGTEHTYATPCGAIINMDFGSRMGQLCYDVRTASSVMRSLSYELLWSQPGGWDYLSEENAARSVEFLPELVAYLMQLTERINNLTQD